MVHHHVRILALPHGFGVAGQRILPEIGDAVAGVLGILGGGILTSSAAAPRAPRALNEAARYSGRMSPSERTATVWPRPISQSSKLARKRAVRSLCWVMAFSSFGCLKGFAIAAIAQPGHGGEQSHPLGRHGVAFRGRVVAVLLLGFEKARTGLRHPGRHIVVDAKSARRHLHSPAKFSAYEPPMLTMAATFCHPLKRRMRGARKTLRAGCPEGRGRIVCFSCRLRRRGYP